MSLSPRPVEGEEEEVRKAKIRRWMVTCKVANYDIAVFYLEQAVYDLNEAVESYFADEAWEKENPRPGDDVHFCGQWDWKIAADRPLLLRWRKAPPP